MGIFDLIFILVFLIIVGLIITILCRGVTGHVPDARRWLKILGSLVAGYLLVVVIVSLASPQRVIATGENLCFDDWCVAVHDVQFTHEIGPARASGIYYEVNIRISNRARGRAQRENGVIVYLLDSEGRRYDPSDAAQRAYEALHGSAASLSSTIPLCEFIDTVRVFDLPADAKDVGLVKSTNTGPGPGMFVIGDGGSLLHRPPSYGFRRPESDSGVAPPFFSSAANFQKGLAMAKHFAMPYPSYQHRRKSGMIRVTAILSVAMLASSALLAQMPDASPEYVATVKPSNPAVLKSSIQLAPGGRFMAMGATVGMLVKFTEDLMDDQLLGGPSWIGSERYDIVAQLDNPLGADPRTLNDEQRMAFQQQV